MTTTYPYTSGWCHPDSNQHDRCLGAYGSVTCHCPHHTEPAPTPEPIPEPEDDYVVEAEVLAGHCPTCSCPSTSDHWEPYTWPDRPAQPIGERA